MIYRTPLPWRFITLSRMTTRPVLHYVTPDTGIPFIIYVSSLKLKKKDDTYPPMTHPLILSSHRAKQLFLAACFSSWSSGFSRRLPALFVAAFIGIFWPAVWTVVLLEFDDPEINATVFANTLHECLLRRRARIIVRNAPRNFGKG